MFEKIKSYLKSFRMSLDTKEVQPLSATSAQSLQYYGNNYNYDTMVIKYKEKIFDLIKQTVSETRKNYIVIEIPKWLDDVPCNGILTELNNLGYSTYKIDNLSIIIISWNKKYL